MLIDDHTWYSLEKDANRPEQGQSVLIADLSQYESDESNERVNSSIDEFGLTNERLIDNLKHPCAEARYNGNRDQFIRLKDDSFIILTATHWRHMPLAPRI